MRKRHIPIADLKISALGKKNVNRALNKNRLSYGPFTKDFEYSFARLHNRKYAMFLSSGTSGLQIAIQAMKTLYGWSDGDEILVPAITFIASPNVVLHNNLRPVFVDVEPDYYCIDPAKIEAQITKRTRAIMPVHLFGQSADMSPILRIARKYKLKIIEDSCETMFVKYRNKPVGSLGDISVYSTYIAHIITTGVGGIITTNDTRLAAMIKSLMFHGRDDIYLTIDDDDTLNKRKLSSLVERRFKFIHIGHSLRNTEMGAALGVAELKRKSEIIRKRQAYGRTLTKKLSKYSDFFRLPEVRTRSEHIYMLYPIIVKSGRIRLNNLLVFLEEHGIETRLFFPVLTQPVYKKLLGNIESRYPVARQLVKNGFIIGSGPYFTAKDIDYIVYIFGLFLKREKLLET